MNSIMETVRDVCNNVRQSGKHGISFQNLLTKLRKEFRDHGFDLKIKSNRSKKLNHEEFYVNAYYDAEDDQNKEIPIEVVVHHNFNKETIWDYKHITDFLIQIFDAVVHEYKHQRQSRKRLHILYWDHIDSASCYHSYLSDPDELDAYAFSIAVELCRTLGKYRALRYLHTISSLAKLKFSGQFVSPNLSAYVGQFGDVSNPLIKRLAKKVYVRLQKIDTDVIFV